jgi:hypothetical protein
MGGYSSSLEIKKLMPVGLKKPSTKKEFDSHIGRLPSSEYAPPAAPRATPATKKRLFHPVPSSRIVNDYAPF